MKDTYRIGKILKKLTGLKFRSSQKDPDISNQGKNYSKSYFSAKAASRQSIDSKSSLQNETDAQKEKYIKYQKECKAHELMGSTAKPKQPGRILKLPVNRKELMSFSED